MSPETIRWQASSILIQLYICSRKWKCGKGENIRFQITNQAQRNGRAYFCVHSRSGDLAFVPSNGYECFLEFECKFAIYLTMSNNVRNGLFVCGFRPKK